MAVRLPSSFNRGFAPGARAAARKFKLPPLPTSIGMRTTFRGSPANNYAPVRPIKPAAAPGGAGGAAPGAPAGPTPRPDPLDPLYTQQLGDLAKARDVDVASLLAQRKQGLAQYGFTENDFDYGNPDRPVGALAVDPNNPFGKAAELKRLYDTSRRATGQSMASGGQLYAGAYQNAQDLVNRQQLGAEDTLQKSLAAFLARNTGDWHKTQTDYKHNVTQLDAERQTRIAENPLYDPTIGDGEKEAKPKAAAKPKAVDYAAQVKGGKYKWPDGKGYVHSRPYRGK